MAACLSQLTGRRRPCYRPTKGLHSAMAHVHHSHKGADLSQAAKATMEKSGEQWTAMRSAVFEALAGFDRPASAYDIAEKVSQDAGPPGRRQQRLPDPRPVRRRQPRPPGRERQRLCRQRPSRLPARLHLPDLRQLRPGHAYRRRPPHRAACARRPRRRLHPRPPGDRGARHLRRVRGRRADARTCCGQTVCTDNIDDARAGVRSGAMSDRVPHTPLLDTVETPADLRKLEARPARASSPTSCAPRRSRRCR